MHIEVRVEGLDKLQAGVAAGAESLPVEVRSAMTESSRLVVNTARSIVPRDTEKLAGSISFVIGGGGANLTSHIRPLKSYGIVIEKGRRPGAAPPPVAALKPWARRHGIPESAVFAVARAIGRRGTKARPFMAPSLEQSRARVVAIFEAVGLRVVARMAG